MIPGNTGIAFTLQPILKDHRDGHLNLEIIALNVHVYVWHDAVSSRVEVRGHLAGVIFLLLPCVNLGD